MELKHTKAVKKAWESEQLKTSLAAENTASSTATIAAPKTVHATVPKTTATNAVSASTIITAIKTGRAVQASHAKAQAKLNTRFRCLTKH